jgi:potassium-transporting ATPase KdpC subunit
MLRQLRAPLVMLLGFTLITGLIYPLAVSGFAWIMMHDAALGSLVVKDGKVVGSSLVGQDFASARYFHPRPSATDPPYNAAASSGSNLGPITQKLLDRTKASVDAMRQQGVAGPVPVDAVTTSASGLDPDISPETAELQVPRVAKARGLAEARVRALVDQQAEGRALGFLGEPHVNVLALNIALDGLQQ